MYLYAAFAFVLTLLLTPALATFMKTHRITGRDVHKPIQPEIPEMGGLSYVLSLIIVFGLAFFLLKDSRITAAVVVIVLLALIGAYDDIKGLNQFRKLVLTLFAGIPVLFFVEDTSVDFVVFSIDFSKGYYILVLLGIAACANATNILAGFNGEEAGMGAVAAFCLGVCCLLLKRDLPQLLLFSLSSSLLAFLIFNKYPAHVFPGDTGTLPIGALIAVSVIFGKVEVLGFIALLPSICEFFLKMGIWFKGKEYGPTQVVNGRLYPPPYVSVANVLTRRIPLTEKTLVILLWAIGGLCGIIAVSASFLIR